MLEDVEVIMMKLSAILGFILAVLPGAGEAQSFEVVDRETGEKFGPFDILSDDSITISGRSYYIVDVDRDSALRSAEDTLASYLMTSNWPDRIQYVVKSDGIVDRMRAYYTDPIIKPDKVSVVATGGKYNGEDDTVILMGTREFQGAGLPPNITTSYVMRSVNGEWLVDWDETDILIEAEEEAQLKAATSAMGLSDAKMEISTLNLRKRDDYTTVEASVRNLSDAEISLLGISFSLYDADGGYVAQGFMHHQNIKPGEDVVISGLAETGKNIPATARYKLTSVDIYTSGGALQQGVQQYFEVTEE